MKKLLLCMLVLVMSLALFSCGGTSDDTTLPAGNDGTQPTITDPVVGDDHVHSFEEVVTLEPTCTSLGKKSVKCACGEVQSDMPIPFAMHDAKDATCTEDSVCATCGKVLVEKYGHLYVDSVITETTCTTDGVAKSACYRCGDSTETVIKASHNFDYNNLIVSKGSVSSKCTKCGTTANFEEGKVILKLDGESQDEISNSGFKIQMPESLNYADGAFQTVGALWFGYQPEILAGCDKLLISFDFKLTAEGYTHRGESIFTFVGGRSTYNWLIKYYQKDGVISTADAGFNSANSVPASLNKWYNLTAIIDMSTNKATVYIDGVNIGSRATINHADAKYNNNFELRFFDVKSNGISMPFFDNFKLVEIK